MTKETQKAKVTIFSQSCKGIDDCGICKFICPKDLFTACEEMNAAGYYPPQIKDEEECTACQNCMIYCPDYAIVVEMNEKEDNDATE